MKPGLSLFILICLLAAGQLSAQVNISSGGTYAEDFDALGTASGTWVDNITLTGEWRLHSAQNLAGEAFTSV